MLDTLFETRGLRRPRIARRIRAFATAAGLVWAAVTAGAPEAVVAATETDAPIVLALDGEFGHSTSTSAQAIERGILIAIDEVNAAGGVLGGRRLAYRKTDNRGIAAMAVDNVRELADRKDVLAVFGGKFSPLQIEVVPVVHAKGLLLLNPWGSANPITDHGLRPSYTFRLSLKDSFAAGAMLDFARTAKNAGKVGLLLPNTAWGRSNLQSLTETADKIGITVVGTRWYNWGDRSLLERYLELRNAGAEALVLVANEVEGALLVREIAELRAADRLPIVSHWGITGGNFHELAGPALTEVDFSVIQTFSFDRTTSPRAPSVARALETRFGISKERRSISVVGTAHAYDLVHLIARAIEKAGSAERAAVRDALEGLGRFEGLVRTYDPPFTPTRHDALDGGDVFFARFGPGGTLEPLPWAVRR